MGARFTGRIAERGSDIKYGEARTVRKGGYNIPETLVLQLVPPIVADPPCQPEPELVSQ